MLIEDDLRKATDIVEHLKTKGISDQDIIHAKNMTDFSANLNKDIGLFIIDFKIPSIDDGAICQNAEAILESIIKAGKDKSLLLAISSYPSDFPELRVKFEAHGCILSDFANKQAWQATLDHLLIQLNKDVRFDFLIFCALQEELNPYIVLNKSGKRIIRGGVNCYDIQINGRKGSIILLPQMGLVNAAITAGLCIDRFKPSLVAMSGICGGFRDRAEMGQLFYSSMAYEYQSGKWAADGFQNEPYQVSTDHLALTNLNLLAETDALISDLEEGFRGSRPSTALKPKAGIFTSGSAVIANIDYMEQIKSIHRKVNALDMEIFAIHRAAQLSPYSPVCICAKTVVDLGDSNKSDNLHHYGSYISAKFIIKATHQFFESK